MNNNAFDLSTPQPAEPSAGNQDQRMLRLMTEVINANLGTAEIQEWLAGRLGEMLSCEAGSILFLLEDRGELVVKKTGDAEPTRLYQLNLRWDEGKVEK
jgi:hypothetical protein